MAAAWDVARKIWGHVRLSQKRCPQNFDRVRIQWLVCTFVQANDARKYANQSFVQMRKRATVQAESGVLVSCTSGWFAQMRKQSV